VLEDRSPFASRPEGFAICSPHVWLSLSEGTRGQPKHQAHGRPRNWMGSWYVDLSASPPPLQPLIRCRHGPSTPEEDHDSGIPCSSAQNLPSLVPECGVEGRTSALTWTYCTRIKEVICRPLQLTQKWKDEVISLDPTGQPVINVTKWLSRTTLDIIGEGKCSASVTTVFT
jgi:hypothetical protein